MSATITEIRQQRSAEARREYDELTKLNPAAPLSTEHQQRRDELAAQLGIDAAEADKARHDLERHHRLSASLKTPEQLAGIRDDAQAKAVEVAKEARAWLLNVISNISDENLFPLCAPAAQLVSDQGLGTQFFRESFALLPKYQAALQESAYPKAIADEDARRKRILEIEYAHPELF
jgi:hypothetical protein